MSIYQKFSREQVQQFNIERKKKYKGNDNKIYIQYY